MQQSWVCMQQIKNMCQSWQACVSEMTGHISTLVSGCLQYMRVFVGHARVCFGSGCVLARVCVTECVSEGCFHWMHEWISFCMAVCECVISDCHYNDSFHLCFCISSQKSEQQSYPRPEKWLLHWLVLP